MPDLEKALAAYAERDVYPFHMPGHKRRCPVYAGSAAAGLTDDAAGAAGTSPAGDAAAAGPLEAAMRIDVTEIAGFDNLHDPKDILLEEMKRAAEFYGTEATLFSVNGTTAANLAAVSASVPKGGTILLSPGAHRSVLHAAELLELAVYSTRGDRIDPTQVMRAAEPEPMVNPAPPEEIRAAFSKRAYDAVAVTSPTYEGAVSDIRAIAEIVHRQDSVLIVDEAHGAHFSMHPYFPESAVRLGADLVTQSLHKTLPAMTQTSLLHNVSGRIPTEKLLRYLDFFETSSPSYVLMASITSCLHFLKRDGREAFVRYAANLSALREHLSNLRYFSLADAELQDPSKLVIGCGDPLPDGPALMRILREEYHLELERCGPRFVLAMTSVCDTEEGFARLADALYDLERRADAGSI